MARSFQMTNLFEQLTLRERTELALMGTTKLGHRFCVSDRVLARFRDHAGELLDEVGLARQHDEPAGTLAYGQKRPLVYVTPDPPQRRTLTTFILMTRRANARHGA
jgi:branched-chain amino acid transport system ATP-binding protein